jgi:hypothetical protein
VAERIARELLRPTERTAARKPASLPTPLTQSNRSAGRDGIRKKSTRLDPAQTLDIPNACKWCGVILENRERDWCEDCYAEHRAEKDRENIAIATAAKLKIAAEGKDPSHGGEAATKRGGANRNHIRLNIEWKSTKSQTMSEADYRQRVLPRLSEISVRELAVLMGVSRGYAAQVKHGKRVPHPRHWGTLSELQRGNARRSTVDDGMSEGG